MLAATSGQEADGEELTQREASRSPRLRSSTVSKALNELEGGTYEVLANWQAGWEQQDKDMQAGQLFSFGSQSGKGKGEVTYEQRQKSETKAVHRKEAKQTNK